MVAQIINYCNIVLSWRANLHLSSAEGVRPWWKCTAQKERSLSAFWCQLTLFYIYDVQSWGRTKTWPHLKKDRQKYNKNPADPANCWNRYSNTYVRYVRTLGLLGLSDSTTTTSKLSRGLNLRVKLKSLSDNKTNKIRKPDDLKKHFNTPTPPPPKKKKCIRWRRLAGNVAEVFIPILEIS